jgi:hypothetical protein
MDTSSLRRRLAPDERARRISEGRCLYVEVRATWLENSR